MPTKNDISTISQSDAIVKAYYAMIYRYCFMKVVHCDIAQDIVQDVFIRFFNRFDRYHKEKKIKEILFSIAHNLCMDYFRKAGNHVEFLYDDDCYQKQATQEVARNLSLASFMQQLHAEVRETIILYYYYEFRIKDIARIMNTSESNVKFRLKSGRDKLKQRFDKEGILYEEWFA